jgi:glycyl-tRNA synthetase beta chain
LHNTIVYALAQTITQRFDRGAKREIDKLRAQGAPASVLTNVESTLVHTSLRVRRQERHRDHVADVAGEVRSFLLDRLRVQLRSEGARYDVLNAVLGAGQDDALVRLLARTDAVTALLGSEDGANLLAAYKRAANILRIEDKKDGPHEGAVDAALLEQDEEAALAAALATVEPNVTAALESEQFTNAMSALATLRAPLDAFFEHVTVNDERPELRRNRLALLHRVRAAMNLAADFSRIEG